MPFEARHRLVEMFDLARELSAVDRAIYLDRECAGEPELRRQIEELLAHDQAGPVVAKIPRDES